MGNIAFLLDKATEILAERGVSTPRLDAVLILQYVLDVDYLGIVEYLHTDVSTERVELFFATVRKRVDGVPISHILGKREFWNMDFEVNSDVLDPRPDTETIVEYVMRVHRNKNRRIVIADLGTGTGCIIAVLLMHYKHSVGVAFEKSVGAYRVAYRNLKRHGLLSRVQLRLADWSQCKGKFDLIISNPPYVKRCKISSLQPEIRFHEPQQAVDGGVTGMEKYVQILKVVKRCLAHDGIAILEIGEDQHTIRNEVSLRQMRFCNYCSDLSGKKRCVVLKL